MGTVLFFSPFFFWEVGVRVLGKALGLFLSGDG